MRLATKEQFKSKIKSYMDAEKEFKQWFASIVNELSTSGITVVSKGEIEEFEIGEKKFAVKAEYRLSNEYQTIGYIELYHKPWVAKLQSPEFTIAKCWSFKADYSTEQDGNQVSKAQFSQAFTGYLLAVLGVES